VRIPSAADEESTGLLLMTAQQILRVLLLFLPMTLGCLGGTKWEPIAESVCQKYEERVTLLQSIRSKSDAKNTVASNKRWQSDYERLVDQYADVLRKHEGEMDFVKYNEFRKRWTQIDLNVNRERERLTLLKDGGAEYDTDLLLITRTSFANPFR
jgi:hypothetical protein